MFGRLVAVRRAALGLSQGDLAARMETSQANVVGIEHGRPPSLETLDRLADVLGAESRTSPAWRSLGGRWRWAGFAIAALIPALLILNGGSGETGRGAASGHLPEAASPPAATPAPAVPVDAHGNPLDLRKSGKEAKAQKASHEKTAGGRPGQQDAGGENPRQSAPEVTLAPTSPAQSAPKPPASAVPTQPAPSSSPSAPVKPTGKPDGSPGNGPGGGGTGGGIGSGGGSGSGGGNGPDGTGAPGQLP